MATFSHYQPKVYDEFFTKENTFKQLAPFIPKNKKIYMPFYSKYSKCNELLGKYIDNKIIYEDKDFFTYKITDGIICDNPPFAIKKKILNKLNGKFVYDPYDDNYKYSEVRDRWQIALNLVKEEHEKNKK